MMGMAMFLGWKIMKAYKIFVGKHPALPTKMQCRQWSITLQDTLRKKVVRIRDWWNWLRVMLNSFDTMMEITESEVWTTRRMMKHFSTWHTFESQTATQGTNFWHYQGWISKLYGCTNYSNTRTGVLPSITDEFQTGNTLNTIKTL